MALKTHMTLKISNIRMRTGRNPEVVESIYQGNFATYGELKGFLKETLKDNRIEDIYTELLSKGSAESDYLLETTGAYRTRWELVHRVSTPEEVM